MKYIKLKGLENEIPIFFEEELCEICSYPLSDKAKFTNRCLGCNIFFKNKKITGGKFYFDKIFSVGKYVDMSKSESLKKSAKDTMTWIILHYKDNKKGEEMVPFCADLLKLKIDEVSPILNLSKENTIICIVPDETSRPYQKAHELASNLSKKIGLEYIPLIKKIKTEKSQHKSKKIEEKFENIKGAFELDKEFVSKIKGKTILLIDDIINSMATINECSKILKENGVEKIFVFSIARHVITPKNGEED